MDAGTKFLINEIICEETAVLTHLNRDVPIGDLAVPPGSELGGQTVVNVTECCVGLHEGLFGAKITLFVQERLNLTTPDGGSFPLEFDFPVQKFIPLMTCYSVGCIETQVDSLNCRVQLLEVSNNVQLGDDGTFDECLTVTVHVQILRERELSLALCPCLTQTGQGRGGGNR
jgi:hypothetical protein